MGRRSYPAAPGLPPPVANLCPVATSTKGPGGASRKGKSATGRASKVGRYKTAEESGRYTAPIPKSVRHSPPWFGALILVLLIGGVAVITVNYLAHLPFMSPRLALGAGGRPGDDLRRLPLGDQIPLTAAQPQPSRSITVALASPPPSHIVSSP